MHAGQSLEDPDIVQHFPPVNTNEIIIMYLHEEKGGEKVANLKADSRKGREKNKTKECTTSSLSLSPTRHKLRKT